MAPTESKLPSAKSRFFVENHPTNDKVVQDLHQIEDFVDQIGGTKRPKDLIPKNTQNPKQLSKLRRVRKKFSEMMQAHPFDKFFDENTLSKAAPDYKNTIK